VFSNQSWSGKALHAETFRDIRTYSRLEKKFGSAGGRSGHANAAGHRERLPQFDRLDPEFVADREDELIVAWYQPCEGDPIHSH
jgi:hypothetical protein